MCACALTPGRSHCSGPLLQHFRGAVGEQVEVELGPDVVDGLGQRGGQRTGFDALGIDVDVALDERIAADVIVQEVA